MVVDRSMQLEIIQSLADRLRADYIFPDIAERICAGLQKHLEDGDYADINEGDFFAFALTTHLQEVNHDEHLWVRWHPEPLPEDDGALRKNREWQEEQLMEARLDNFGFHRVERLPGNVGYLDIRHFHRAAWGGDTAAAAMNFLVNSSALVIDLRKCTGGYPAMIALVLSYLFAEEPIHLSSIYWRDEDLTQQYWTLPYVPGKRFGDIPVFVLTSKGTFSGGEEFAAILQTRKRATIIGDQTDGGAHPGASYRLHPHFEVFIPIGRATNPVTGMDLEGTGVRPDICIPQEHAYLAAYSMALKHILANLSGSTGAAQRALAKEAQAAINSLGAGKTICPKCGYPNLPGRVKCKNCAEGIPD